LRGVEHAAVGVERLVLQHQWDLVWAGGQPKRIVGLARVLVVADDVGPGEARVHVGTRVAQRVVVVPDHRRPLLVVVREPVGDVVRALLAASGEPLQRRTVELRMVLAPVQVGDDRGGRVCPRICVGMSELEPHAFDNDREEEVPRAIECL
jgi:hypothetical protein